MKKIERSEPASLDFAERLFTRGTDVFGPKEIQKVFGAVPAHIPNIPFTEQELVRARELDQYLILQTDKTTGGKPLTMKSMHSQFDNKLGEGKLLYNTDWYGQKEVFYTTDVSRFSWRLTSREVISSSTSQNYIGRTQAIVNYLQDQVYKGEELPHEYRLAVEEFKNKKSNLEELLNSDWQKCAAECVGLRINQLFCERPVEVLYGLVVQHQINGEYLLRGRWTWTSVLSSVGFVVAVGSCGPGGVRVVSGDPRDSFSDLGVRFSRSAVTGLE